MEPMERSDAAARPGQLHRRVHGRATRRPFWRKDTLNPEESGPKRERAGATPALRFRFIAAPKRSRDLPDPVAIPCGPAPQPKGLMLSLGDGSSPFPLLSRIPAEPSDRSSPLLVRGLFVCAAETRSPWSSLTLRSKGLLLHPIYRLQR